MTTAHTHQHIEVTPGIASGRPRIAGHRITVQDVVIWHEWLGRSADEISAEHGLDLVDIYAALAYYYDHQTEIDRTIREQDDFVAALMQRMPSKLAMQRVIAAHG